MVNTAKLDAFYRSQFNLTMKSGPRKHRAESSADSDSVTMSKVPRMDKLAEDVQQLASTGLLEDLSRLNSKCTQLEIEITKLKKETQKLKLENERETQEA